MTEVPTNQRRPMWFSGPQCPFCGKSVEEHPVSQPQSVLKKIFEASSLASAKIIEDQGTHVVITMWQCSKKDSRRRVPSP